MAWDRVARTLRNRDLNFPDRPPMEFEEDPHAPGVSHRVYHRVYRVSSWGGSRGRVRPE